MEIRICPEIFSVMRGSEGMIDQHILPLVAEGGICGSIVKKLGCLALSTERKGVKVVTLLAWPSPLRCREYQREAAGLLNQREEAFCG